MKYHIKLLRPKDWAKNLFLFVPSFFAKHIFTASNTILLVAGFIAFCCIASSIYIINDYRDIEDDRKHPTKSKRPLASGKVKPSHAIVMLVVLIILGTGFGYAANPGLGFLLVLGVYFLLNLAYSFGLKNIAILDMLILSAGFVFRVKGGGIITHTDTTEWMIIMTYLLAMFMALGKRRDDLLLKETSGTEMRKSVNGYTMEYLNLMLGLFSAIIIVAYISYTQSPKTINRLGTYRLYYSSVFVIAGIMRYMQIVFVNKNAGSPTEVLYRDRFIQITILLWIASIYVILYMLPHTPIFLPDGKAAY
ncbi:decaprenyl-phosphate phosphoribosyltransferase [Mucilaginibacter sp. L3T2-6]|uniref:decaprenyl-phosphate phosphoribosyltransferase n=1 Tax=Mucilaginibacter sp. L3T2-6 TaxID=3062491 RepID=UPI002676069E|nr:decaprenyl-phosphate phosphoribosyltransferase [Mucilaginibacter sp. L3T2-6]MDO3642863.1 decaprenyl-phosphate phosphoribosyltransferase [Mucilaginibacter sp. L3T2-6]MDV6215188.1 decaprenyl-phosphate phosphoribosyltransferase [Mucilaginibacter sp. L3T2-6]